MLIPCVGFAFIVAIVTLTVCQASWADSTALKIKKTSIGCPTVAIADSVYRALDETEPKQHEQLAVEAVKRWGCVLFLPGEIVYVEGAPPGLPLKVHRKGEIATW